ncbi:MAG: pyridoxamine 5'-phosphate oxidase family protein [Candidatus Thorarchaeota archaeon]
MASRDGESSWRLKNELSPEMFQLLQKIGGKMNPSSVIATVDEDGSPRTAPFGSLHAITPVLLRAVVNRHHDSLTNIRREPRIMIFVACSPSLAISIKGIARVVKDPWDFDPRYAIVEIEIKEIKNDLPREISIESGIEISSTNAFQDWWHNCWKELHRG